MDGVARNFPRYLVDDEVDAVGWFLARLHDASQRCGG
jgi:hypothetical protein